MKLNLLLLGAVLLAQVTMAGKSDSLQSIPMKDINGNATSLKDFNGKVILLVNVASKCGNTPQYEGLEKMYEKYKDQGFVIIGVPCNDFAGQEPGSADQIKAFCTEKYNVSFPLMEKVHVKGKEQHPLYVALTGKEGAFPGDVKWNFGKFLIDRDGKPLQRFEPGVKPENPELVQAVETALAKK